MRPPRLLHLLLPVLLVLSAAPALAKRDGFVSERSARKAADQYLRFATEEIATGSILNAIAHMERDRTDPKYTAPPGSVDAPDWSAVWDKLDHLRDTRDFDALYLLVALLGYEDDPYLTAALWDRIRQSLLSFKMWFTDPTPLQPDPADPERDYDDSYYWSENHQILFHVIEYLAGQRFPEECFWIEGLPRSVDCSGEGEMTGAEHLARARGFIERWMEERWEAGFSEWLSNVYYQKDVTPLLTLVGVRRGPGARARAPRSCSTWCCSTSRTTCKRGVFGSTHGRSYMKDKYRGLEDDTWGWRMLLFDDRAGRRRTCRAATPARRCWRARTRYRLPEAIQEAARPRGSSISRTRQSFAVDEGGGIIEDPPYPPGHSFEDTEPQLHLLVGPRRPDDLAGRSRSPCWVATVTTSGTPGRCGPSSRCATSSATRRTSPSPGISPRASGRRPRSS